jgi:formylglycine-generating enzyme required for sulfatase activity
MVYIPESEFLMGLEDTDDPEYQEHSVYLDAFWIDSTEITNAMYAVFLSEVGNLVLSGLDVSFYDAVSAEGHLKFVDGLWTVYEGFENHQVVAVTWYGAEGYCEWAGRRLPTEAEWERAARGIDGRTYPWGDEPPAGERLNFADVNLSSRVSDATVNDGYQYTAPVGNYPAGASPYGALDMAGNVMEWVADFYDPAYYTYSPSENPRDPKKGILMFCVVGAGMIMLNMRQRHFA